MERLQGGGIELKGQLEGVRAKRGKAEDDRAGILPSLVTPKKVHQRKSRRRRKIKLQEKQVLLLSPLSIF